eukprot:764023-Hanusia_phi.AAC.1
MKLMLTSGSVAAVPAVAVTVSALGDAAVLDAAVTVAQAINARPEQKKESLKANQDAQEVEQASH